MAPACIWRPLPPRWSNDLVAAFRDGMTSCFTEALHLGLTIGVRPHLVSGRDTVQVATAALPRDTRKLARASSS